MENFPTPESARHYAESIENAVVTDLTKTAESLPGYDAWKTNAPSGETCPQCGEDSLHNNRAAKEVECASCGYYDSAADHEPDRNDEDLYASVDDNVLASLAEIPRY